jgi:hypothetical protein
LYVDPDGKKITIYYAGGSFVYGVDKVPDDAQVAQFVEAIEFLRKSETASIQIDYLMNRSENVDLRFWNKRNGSFTASNDEFDAYNTAKKEGNKGYQAELDPARTVGVIFWNPLLAANVWDSNAELGKEAGRLAPSLLLMHEITHAGNLVQNAFSFFTNSFTPIPIYDDKEEKSTIGVEQTIIRELNAILGGDSRFGFRTNHRGVTFLTIGVNSTATRKEARKLKRQSESPQENTDE